MSKQNKFGIVLVNYKTPQITPVCLKLLQQALTKFNAEVWVVDNNSADESVDFLRKQKWIRLIERQTSESEAGYLAHGRALDMVLEKIETDYLFLMHTDTMIYNPEIFNIFLQLCDPDKKIVAAGCVEQINRGKARIAWRVSTRFIKHYSRKLKKMFGIESRPPKPYIEHHLKSFFALWNIRIMKKHKLTFSLDNQTPGYAAQDRLIELGYKVKSLSTGKVFHYLDHIQGGTKSFGLGEVKNQRLKKNLKALSSVHEKIGK